MKKLFLIPLIAFFFILYSCSSPNSETIESSSLSDPIVSTTEYALNENQYITWKAKHNDDTAFAYTSRLIIRDGSINTEGQNINRAKFAFDIASLADTNLPSNLIKHLKGADYFNVSAFPLITFYVNEVANGIATGELSIVGIKKTIDFPVSIELNDKAFNAKAEFDLDMLPFEFPHLVKTHQKTPEEKKSGPSNIVSISFDISATPLN